MEVLKIGNLRKRSEREDGQGTTVKGNEVKIGTKREMLEKDPLE